MTRNIHQNLFLDELPLVSSEAELTAVKQQYPDLDEWYVASACCEERRKAFEELWRHFEPFADNHFLDQVKKKFHQRTWEMYVGYTLSQKSLLFTSNSEGPDFFLNDGVYLECVACTPGTLGNVNSVPEHVYGEWMPLPQCQIGLRIAQVFKEKSDKYLNKWSGKPWFTSTSPYVIAINIGELNYIEDSKMPSVLKVMLGIGDRYFIPSTREQGYSQQFTLTKQTSNGSVEIDIAYFHRPEFSHISGVLFSNETILNHMNSERKECFYANNPFAMHKPDYSFVERFNRREISQDNGVLKWNYIPAITT